MDPPPYDEATLHPPVSGGSADIAPPPPSYDASLSAPPPPPSYEEAVTENPFPILTPPQATGDSVHPTTFINVRSSTSVQHLRSVPAIVRCPHCGEVVTSKVVFRPGILAWVICYSIAMSGLICGFCLIPFCTKCSMDVHHVCPLCRKRIYSP